MLTHAQGTRWRMPLIIGVMQSAGSWLKPAISICGKEVVHWVLLYPYTLGIHIISWPWRVEQSPCVRLIISWCNELRPGAMSYMFKVRFQWYCLILWKYVYPSKIRWNVLLDFQKPISQHWFTPVRRQTVTCGNGGLFLLTHICVTKPQRINRTDFVPQMIIRERNWNILYWHLCCRFP